MGVGRTIIGLLAPKFVKSLAKYIVEAQAFLLVNVRLGDAALDVGQTEAWIVTAVLTGIEWLIDTLKEKNKWSWL